MSFDSSKSEYVYPSSSESQPSSLQFLLNATQFLEDTASSNFQPRTSIDRRRDIGLQTLLNDWFVKEPKYDEAYFRKKFRMNKSMFLKIVGNIEERYPYFQEGYDVRGEKVSRRYQRRPLGNSQRAIPPDDFDEYVCMPARTSCDNLNHFCDAIIQLYGREYLRKPTAHDVAHIFEAHEARHHIPGMLGSIDCTHFEWLNCPRSLRGQYTRGDHGVPTIMLEVTASQDLWIWHAFFSPPGSNNDINVLNQSDLYLTKRNGTAANSSFYVGERFYKCGYYLTNGIYPKWSTFVKAYPYPTDPKEKKFKRLQEGARKDVERAFGVLKGKRKILSRPIQAMTKDKIDKFVHACIILHNMVIKGDGREISPVHIMDEPVQPVFNDSVVAELLDEDVHHRLRYDLTVLVAAQDLPYLEDD